MHIRNLGLYKNYIILCNNNMLNIPGLNLYIIFFMLEPEIQKINSLSKYHHQLIEKHSDTLSKGLLQGRNWGIHYYGNTITLRCEGRAVSFPRSLGFFTMLNFIKSQ